MNGGTLSLNVDQPQYGTLYYGSNSGSTTVNSGGTLLANNYNALTGWGNNASAVVINPGGTLANRPGFTNHIVSLTLAGGTLAGSPGSVDFGGFDVQFNSVINVTASSTISTIALTMEPGSSFNVVGGATLSLTGSIADSAATAGVQLVKNGAGTMVVAGASTYTGTTSVNAGVLQVDGVIGTGAVSVAPGATLSGSGSVPGAVTVSTGATLAPGDPTATGILSTGPLTLQPAATLATVANGSIPGSGYDQVNVNGSVALGNARLAVTTSQTPPAGSNLVFVKVVDSAQSTGTFAGIAQDSSLAVGGSVYLVTYLAGSTGSGAGSSFALIDGSQLPTLGQGLAATAVSSTYVNLTWFGGLPTERFVIERSTDSTFPSDNTVTFSVPPGSLEYPDTTVGGGTTYYYRIAGVTNGLSSAMSRSVSVSTPPIPADLVFTNDGPGFVGSPIDFRFASTGGQPATIDYGYAFDGDNSFTGPDDIAATGSNLAEYTFSEPGIYTVYGRIVKTMLPLAGPPGSFTDYVLPAPVTTVYQTTVTVNPAPQAVTPPVNPSTSTELTNTGPAYAGFPVSVRFTDPVVGERYNFDFDGSNNFGEQGNVYNSTSPVAKYVFYEPGTYTVTGFVSSPPPTPGSVWIAPGTSTPIYTTEVTVLGGVAGPVGSSPSPSPTPTPTPSPTPTPTPTPTSGALDVSEDSYRFAELTWGAFTPSDGKAATEYQIYETDLGGAGSTPQSGFTPGETLVDTIPASQTFYYANDLQPYTTYAFRVAASDGTATASATAQATTLMAVPLPVQGEVLAGSAPEAESLQYFNESWYNSDPTVTQYIVEQSDEGGPYYALSPTVPDGNPADDSTPYYYGLNFTNNGNLHETQVIAVNPSGRSDLPLPATPSGLVVATPGAGEAVLTWANQASTNADGILVDVSQNGGGFRTLAQLAGTATTYTFSTLAPGTYTFRVRSYNARADETSNTADGTIYATGNPSLQQAPNTPVASNITTDSATLTWNDMGAGISYVVEQQFAGSSVFQQVAVVSSPTYAVTNLQDDQSYMFAVRAIDGQFNGSPLSAPSTFTTLLAPPAPPKTWLVITPHLPTYDGGDGGVTDSLIWGQVYDATSYNVQYTDDGALKPIANYPASQTREDFVFGPTVDGTEVRSFAIQAVNAAGESAWVYFGAGANLLPHSGGTATTNPTAGSVPTDPTGATATRVSPSEIDVTWQDNSDNENGFYVRRLEVDADGDLLPDGAQWTVGPNTTFFADTSVDATTSYSYEVSAFNGAGESGESITGDADEPGDPGTGQTPTLTIAAPTKLEADTLNPGTVHLSWYYDQSLPHDGFVIMRDDNASGTFQAVGTVAADTTTFDDTGVSSGSTYTYYVYATYEGQQSDGSNSVTAQPAVGLPAPTGLTATTTSSTAITLTWDAYPNTGNTGGFQIDVIDGDHTQTVDVSNPTATSYTVGGLQPSTTYTFVIRAVDASGNQSENSAAPNPQATTNPADIGTLNVADGDTSSDAQPVQATAADPTPSTALDVTADEDGDASILLSATADSGSAADANVLWQVLDADGNVVDNGDFGAGNATVDLTNNTDAAEHFVVQAGPDDAATGELTDDEVHRTIDVTVEPQPQLTSLTVSVPGLPGVTATADTPGQPVNLYIPVDYLSGNPNDLDGSLTLSATGVPTDPDDATAALWNINGSGFGADPNHGDFFSNPTQTITIRPEGPDNTTAITAWYDGNGNGTADAGEDTFEVDVHVVTLESLKVTNDSGDANEGADVTASDGTTTPTLTVTAGADGSATVDLNAAFDATPDDAGDYTQAASLISYEVSGGTASPQVGSFDVQTGDYPDDGVSVSLQPGAAGGDYTITAFEDANGNGEPDAGQEFVRSVEVKVLPAVYLTSLTVTDDTNTANAATAYADPTSGPAQAALTVTAQASGSAVIDLSSVPATPMPGLEYVHWSITGQAVTPQSSGTFSGSPITLTLTPGSSEYDVQAWSDSTGAPEASPPAGATPILEVDIHVVQPTPWLQSLTVAEDGNSANSATAYANPASGPATLTVAAQASGSALIDLSDVAPTSGPGRYVHWSISGQTVTPQSTGTFNGSPITLTLTPGDTTYDVLAWPDTNGAPESAPPAGVTPVLEVDVHVVQVSLTAYRTGGDFGQAVAKVDQESNDPSRYVVLVNDNFDQALAGGMPDDSATTAPIQGDQMALNGDNTPLDPDFGRITLNLTSGLTSGTVKLTLSDASAVQLFKGDGTELTSTSLDLANPNGDLQPLATGSMDVWFEGLKVDSDLTVALKYSNTSGEVVSQDQVHVDVADLGFVDTNGSPIYQLNPVWTDALNAVENADPDQLSINTDFSTWNIPDVAAKVQLLGLADPSIAQVSESIDGDPGNSSTDDMTVSGQDITSALPILLADDGVVAPTTAPADPTGITTWPDANARVAYNPKTGLNVKVALGNFDTFFRNLAVQKLQVTLDTNGLYAAGNNNVGYTVSVLNPAKNANYQLVTYVDGTWTQFNGSSHHFSAAVAKATPAGVDGVYAYDFVGPNAAQQATAFINAQNGSTAPLYGPYFATASAAFYVGDAQTEQNQWFQQAWNSLIANNPTSGNPIVRNRLITQAYVSMYSNNSSWAKWAGMAAFASYEVGTGIAGGTVLNAIFPNQPIQGEVPIYEALQEGNFEVYSDIYPQFLAYQSGGLGAVQAMGGLVANAQLQGWTDITNGLNAKGGPNMNTIWTGNQELLQYEQQVVLQKGAYDIYPNLWASVSSYAPSYTLPFVKVKVQAPPGFILVSPIPGNGGSFGTVVSPTLQQGQPLNIGDFNQRWLWITDPISKQDPTGGQLVNFENWAAANNAMDFNKLMAGGYS